MPRGGNATPPQDWSDIRFCHNQRAVGDLIGRQANVVKASMAVQNRKRKTQLMDFHEEVVQLCTELWMRDKSCDLLM